MIEDQLAAVVQFLADNEDASASRVAKQLGLSQSELLRVLALLGEQRAVGGLGLVASREEGSRRLLSLTDEGRAWLRRHA